MKEDKCFFCRKVRHLTKTSPTKAALDGKPKNWEREVRVTPIPISQTGSPPENLETPLPEHSDSSEDICWLSPGSSTC
jgi:hypothetical protein